MMQGHVCWMSAVSWQHRFEVLCNFGNWNDGENFVVLQIDGGNGPCAGHYL